MLCNVLSALRIIIHLALRAIPLEVGTVIIPTDDDNDDIRAHSVTNMLRVLTASKWEAGFRPRPTGSRIHAPKHYAVLP